VLVLGVASCTTTMCDCKTFPGSRRLVLTYLDDLPNHFRHFLGSKLADLVKHDMAIRGKQTGQLPRRPSQISPGFVFLGPKPIFSENGFAQQGWL